MTVVETRWLANEWVLRGGADKSLARPTFRCRRTESIVSFERGVCSCVELQVFFLVTEAERKRVRRRTLFQQHGDASWHRFFFLQGKTPKEIHAILTETLGEHAPSHATVRHWVAQFKRGDFSTCDSPRPGRPKTVTTPEIIDQIHELFLEDRRI